MNDDEFKPAPRPKNPKSKEEWFDWAWSVAIEKDDNIGPYIEAIGRAQLQAKQELEAKYELIIKAGLEQKRIETIEECAKEIESIVGDWPEESQGHSPIEDGQFLADHIRTLI